MRDIKAHVSLCVFGLQVERATLTPFLTLLVFFCSAQFLTRGYNGQMPGPTIRISPGSPLNVAIVNGLEEDDTGLSPNSTNFHAHGLHVDPGGDDVFLHIGPGSEHKFEYQVYADHMSGSFYYHPHLHLTSSLQAGGGATGEGRIYLF